MSEICHVCQKNIDLEVYNCCDCGVNLCYLHAFYVEGDGINVYCENHAWIDLDYMTKTHPDIRKHYHYGNKKFSDKVIEFFTCNHGQNNTRDNEQCVIL